MEAIAPADVPSPVTAASPLTNAHAPPSPQFLETSSASIAKLARREPRIAAIVTSVLGLEAVTVCLQRLRSGNSEQVIRWVAEWGRKHVTTTLSRRLIVGIRKGGVNAGEKAAMDVLERILNEWRQQHDSAWQPQQTPPRVRAVRGITRLRPDHDDGERTDTDVEQDNMQVMQVPQTDASAQPPQADAPNAEAPDAGAPDVAIPNAAAPDARTRRGRRQPLQRMYYVSYVETLQDQAAMAEELYDDKQELLQKVEGFDAMQALARKGAAVLAANPTLDSEAAVSQMDELAALQASNATFRRLLEVHDRMTARLVAKQSQAAEQDNEATCPLCCNTLDMNNCWVVACKKRHAFCGTCAGRMDDYLTHRFSTDSHTQARLRSCPACFNNPNPHQHYVMSKCI